MSLHETTMLDGDRLAELVQEQLDVLLQLQRMGQQQQEMIVQGRVSELLSLLAEKQQLLQRLTEVQQSLRPASQQPPDARRWSSAQRKQQCQAISAQCDALLAEILETEAASEASLVESRDALAVRLQQSTGALHAARTYQGALSDLGRPASRLDLSSGS